VNPTHLFIKQQPPSIDRALVLFDLSSMFSRDLTCRFDPTSVGLPADFRLTDWSKLKG
jgi:hypothetical protein